jgi:amino acid transporter
MTGVPESRDPRSNRAEVLTSHADLRRVYPETLGYRIKRTLLGRPFVTEQLAGERLGRPTALGVLAPDCISSSAYGTEQILTQLTPAIGIAAFSLVVPIMFVILGVLFFVTLSYMDVIRYYTTAGGSYVVARDNFGPRVAQIAAVALLIDYTVTVAVQCSAGTDALVSAVPKLGDFVGSYSILFITLAVVALLIYGNLRGIREAGRFFALPTYFYVIMVGATILFGVYKEFAGTLHHIARPPIHLLVEGKLPSHSASGFLMGVAFLTLLRAYANGGSSLTGLEAISNGVQTFRRPESVHARTTLVTMSSILGFLLLGVTLLARWTHALPYGSGTPTVLSQEVKAVFGSHGFGLVVFYGVQLATVLILYTGGNTSFNGFPFLANYVASDKYLPRQLTKRGHRLAFSNGIIVLGIVSVILIVAFNANVTGLVSLYAIGVFTGFTMAGAGMVKRHLTLREGKWKWGVIVNALSGTVTAIVVLIFATVKFAEGAWVVVVVGPLMYLALVRLNKQYVDEEDAFEASRQKASTQFRLNRLVVFVDSYDLATERALRYCETLNAFSVRAVHFDIDPAVTKALEAAWAMPGTASASVNLEIVECEDRRVDRAALELVADMVRDPDVFCMVILPRRGFSSRLQRLLHDRTADTIAGAIMHVPRTAATIIPYRPAIKADVTTLAREEAQSDEVVRGGVREDAHLEADVKLAERAIDSVPIGGLRERDHAEVAGRVRSMTLTRERGGSDLRCVLADSSGSISLVFQGRNTIPGIERGTRLLVKGTVTALNREAVILNPEYEIVAGPASDE